MASSAVISQDLWSQKMPLPTGDVLNQIAHTLELLGYSKTVAALTKEAGKNHVVVNTAEWTRAIKEKTGVPLLELYELWLKKKDSLPTMAVAKVEEASDSSSSDSESDSDSDASMADAVEGGALVDVEAEETSDDSSDEESSASSDSSSEEEEQVAVVEKKRKRVVTPPSSDSSDAESSADEAPITKKVKTTEAKAKAASVSSSSASDSSSASSSSDSSSDSDSDSSSPSGSSSSDSSSSDDSSSDDSSSSSESDAAPPPKKVKKEKKVKVEEVPKVAIVEVKPKKEKKDKKDKTPKVEVVEAVVVEAPSSGSSATLEAESASEAAENVQESSIHPSRLAQVPVVDLPAATRKQIAAEGKGAVIPFSRIPVDQKVDPRFASNAYVSYDYADRAHRDLVVTKGKGFTKEKNKKKRGESKFLGGYELRRSSAMSASVLSSAFPNVATPDGLHWRKPEDPTPQASQSGREGQS